MIHEATPAPRWYEALGVAVTLIAAVALVFVVWQVAQLNREVGVDRVRLERERLAVRSSEQVVAAMKSVVAYRDALVSNGSPAEVASARSIAEGQVQGLEAEFTRGAASSLGLQSRMDAIQSKAGVAFRAPPGQAGIEPVNALVRMLKDTLGTIEDNSGLTYDPSMVAQNLADIAFVEMPYALDAVSRSRLETQAGVDAHRIELPERLSIAGDIDTMKAVLDISGDNMPGVTTQLNQLMPNDAPRFTQLAPLSSGVQNAGIRYRELLSRSVVMANAADVPIDRVNAVARDVLDRIARMRSAAAEALSASLVQRAQDQTVRNRLIYIAALAGAVMLVGIMMVLAQMVARRGRRALRLAQEESARLTSELARQRAEEALRLSEAQFRAVFDGAALGIAIIDRNGSLVDANDVFRAMFGDTVADAIRGHETDLAELWAGARDTFEFEQHTRTALGKEIWADAIVSVVSGRTGAPLFAICTFRDKTALKHNERRMLHDKTHDALTGLPNRQLFEEHLRRRFAESSGLLDSFFAVLFVDLEHFKDVNESMGHAAGDFVLTQVAQRLRASVDARDIVARLGSDEFAILIQSLGDILHVEAVARRALNGLSKVIGVSTRSIYLGASVGIAIGSATYERAEDVMRDAEIAMQHAKGSGGARYALFDSKMHARAQKRLQLTTDLRLALERNEFRLLYQPIVDIEGGRVVACEALLRWDHPVEGVLNPTHFIPLAEQTGASSAIGRYVLETSAAQLSMWRRNRGDDLDFSVHVNISAGELLDPDFERFLVQTVEHHRVSPASLVLEITENVILDSGTRATTAIERLRELGFNICIDDFGTGYSSLRYLQQFKVDQLKIDRTFVTGADGELASEPIVRTLMTLAESYGVRVVAEGVETTRQRDLLLNVGCRLVQGYLYARPLSAAEMVRLYPEVLARTNHTASA